MSAVTVVLSRRDRGLQLAVSDNGSGLGVCPCPCCPAASKAPVTANRLPPAVKVTTIEQLDQNLAAWGTELSPALGIGAFVEKTLVAAGQCTKVNPAIPAATAGLLGCGVMAGIGAAINTGAVTRGDSVAVFGCGAFLKMLLRCSTSRTSA